MIECIFYSDLVFGEFFIEVFVVLYYLPEVNKLIRPLAVYLAPPVVVKLWSM